jgi:hypothetical protein
MAKESRMSTSDRSSWEEAEHLSVGNRAVEETRLDANILCARCQWGHLYRRRRRLEFQVFCNSLERHVPADIVECSRFCDTNALSLTDMVRVALPVDPRPGIDDRSYR